MQPKLLRVRTPLGEFDAHVWDGVNASGYRPMGDRVLVLPDQASEQTSGGIFLDESTRERVTAASETGVMVAMGDEAFLWNADRRRRWEGEKPKPGDRVYYERYAGTIVHGDDGLIYRVMDDKAIAAIRL